MKGRRVFHDGAFLRLAEGDYGQEVNEKWSLRPPGHHAGGIPDHTVIEHEDRTITVEPSIVLHNEDGSEAWHGWLRRGEWTEA